MEAVASCRTSADQRLQPHTATGKRTRTSTLFLLSLSGLHSNLPFLKISGPSTSSETATVNCYYKCQVCGLPIFRAFKYEKISCNFPEVCLIYFGPGEVLVVCWLQAQTTETFTSLTLTSVNIEMLTTYQHDKAIVINF